MELERTMKREALRDAVKRVAWGYLLLHLDLNLGTMDVLPNWLGYVLFLRALPVLAEEERSAALLRPLGILLAAWEAAVWAAAILGAQIPDGGILSVLATVIALYFHFQLLTELARIAGRYGCPEARRILMLRTVRTVLITLLSLPFPWEAYAVVTWIVILVHVAAAVWICVVLFSLRRSLMETAGSEMRETEG